MVRRFDRVINLDASRVSASLAAAAQASRKDGFVLASGGHVQATNTAARQWLEAGIFDDLKREGTVTYQDRMAAILGVEGFAHRYVLHLRPDETVRAREHLISVGFRLTQLAVGLNTGAGGRWPLKQWREEAYVDLIRRFNEKHDVQFVLLGGPEEAERNERIRKACGVPVVDPGCQNPIRHFAALVQHCDVLVTGDTLAMHIALALQRRAVILFGPTSAPEIETYGLGEKVLPDMTCLSCYKTSCDFVPNCMDLISVDMVKEAVERQLSIAREARGDS
jgi:heptosyltransferase-2